MSHITRKFCNHCGEYVSRNTFYRHRQEEARNKRFKENSLDSDDEWTVSEFNSTNTAGTTPEQTDNDRTSVGMPASDDETQSSLSEIEEFSFDDIVNEEDISAEQAGYIEHDSLFDDDSDVESLHDDTQAELFPKQVTSILRFLLIWQFLYNISDAAITMLLSLLKYLFKLIATTFTTSNQQGNTWISSFPSSLKKIHNHILKDNICFNEYVVCPKCHSLYDITDCIEKIGSLNYSKKCSHVQYPQHSMSSQRLPCGTPLMRTIPRHSTADQFRPFKVYAYQPLTKAVNRLLKRKGFLDLCEQWRQRVKTTDILSDIYDGQLWQQEFQSFLSKPHSWLLAINVDWFQPFTHVTDSVGVIYLVILNLPRERRYEKHNMILVGIIPGPHEPRLTINSYLTPLILELKQFFAGCTLNYTSKTGQCYTTVIKLALVGIFSDLPASKKITGFCSYNSKHGCSKCFKAFPTSAFGESPDFSGYDVSQWPKRDWMIHKQMSYQHLHAKNKSQQKLIEKDYGLRYSVVNELPYFNAIKHTVIDPMHNLFLGTTKFCLNFWLKNNILTKPDLEKVEQLMSLLHAPHSAGRLPIKISSQFCGFTADQWKNWAIYYSPLVLRGILPNEHLQYWLSFSKACRLLSVPCVNVNNVHLSDKYLQMFCSKFQVVNGSQSCTPNMHLHLHLKECILDYGPLYAFWCFPFERYNGMLGNFPTNLRHIEPQLMKKCLMLQELHSHNFHDDEDLLGILENKLSQASGSLSMNLTETDFLALSKFTTNQLNDLDFTIQSYEKCLPPYKFVVLDDNTCASLKSSYKLLYPNFNHTRNLHKFVKKSTRASLGAEVFGSVSTSRDGNIVVCANWPITQSEVTNQSFQLSIGEIQYFIEHKLIEESGNCRHHIFANVHWFKRHQQHDFFGSTAVVCQNQKADENSYRFIPLKRIISLCIYGVISITFNVALTESVFVAIPVNNKQYY